MATKQRRTRSTRAKWGKARKAGRKFKAWAKSKKGKRTLLVGGAAALGLYLLISKGGFGGATKVDLSLKPIEVKAGEPVSATSYRIIKNRRLGMTYDAATGTPGPESPISFTPSVSGLFTRNYVLEGNSLWAETKAS